MDTNIHKIDLPDDIELYLASEILKMASDPTRLKILWALLHGEHSVNELASHIDARPAAVSQHLSKLRLTRLVRVRRDGNTMYYSTEDNHIKLLIEQALSHAHDKVRELQ